MDAFFASVEQRDHPELRGKPIAVGGSPSGRGVVAAASYEARKFGVRSAMPSARAIRLCPHIQFVKPRFEAYKKVSQDIRNIFLRYTDLIEPLSLDEAYLDVTHDKLGIGSAIQIAKDIKTAIYSELNLTASAGISTNKFVAKIASDVQKPDGLTFIGPSKISGFLDQLPIEKFYGVGQVTAQKMKRMQIFNGHDLRQHSLDDLTHHFGKLGKFLHAVIRGNDDRAVQPTRPTKSLGAEETFEKDLTELEELQEELALLAEKVAKRLEQKNLQGRTLTLKVKYDDFTQITRNYSRPAVIFESIDILKISSSLLERIDIDGKGIRLLGISLSNFEELQPKRRKYPDPNQLDLFDS